MVCQPCDEAGAAPSPKRPKRDHACHFPGCTAAFARSSTLANHKRTHTGEKPYGCDFPGCTEAFARLSTLANHKRTHTGEKPYACDFPGCTKEFATWSILANHKRTHTGEKPYACDIPGCTETFAQSGTLVKHSMRRHTDTYIARRKIQEERVCTALKARGWKEWYHPETMPPPGSFKREKRIDFQCVDSQETWCRIDFVLGMNTGYVFLEVDESQHRFGYDAMLGCDMKRMAKVMASVTIEAGTSLPNVFWLRYNPHAWRVDGALRSVLKAEREAWLCAYLSDLTLHRRLRIGYAYYDSTDGVLEVLNNDEYHSDFADVVVNLME